jgi:bifunctional non-homologous end joining protein LigD
MSKAARSGKIFIDYLRNSRGATSVAAYSTRARAGAPVSAPVSWDELSSIHSAAQFTVENVPDRLARLKRDPWHDLASTKQSISKSLLKKLGTS